MHADAGILHAENARAQFQRQEMQTDQQNAFAVLACQLHVFHAAHLEPAGDAPVGPEPGHADFEQAHADGLKILTISASRSAASIAGSRVPNCGALFYPAFHQAHGYSAEAVSKPIYERVGQ